MKLKQLRTTTNTGRLCSVYCPTCGRVTDKVSFNLLREAGVVCVICPSCGDETEITYDGTRAVLRHEAASGLRAPREEPCRPTYGWSRELTETTRKMLENSEALGASLKCKDCRFGVLLPSEKGGYEITLYNSNEKIWFKDVEDVLKAGWVLD